MNNTVIAEKHQNAMSEGVYIGLLIGGPIFLTILMIILFVVLRLYIQSRQQQCENNHQEMYEMRIEGEDVSTPEIRPHNYANEMNLPDSEHLTLESWVIHHWVPHIQDGDYVDMSNIFIRVSVDTYLLN